MNDIEKLLNSMVEDMKNYKAEYNNISAQINSIMNEYNTKINELQKQRLQLQQEGNKKLESLEVKREQLSGKYSGLYEQFKKFTGTEPNLTENNDTVNSVESSKVAKENLKKVSSKNVSKTKNTKVEEVSSKDTSLSPDEIAKLSKITSSNIVEDTHITDDNGNEIPEYLQDSYVK